MWSTAGTSSWASSASRNAAAGIPYVDDEGRAFDFHAVRGRFISLLAAKGGQPKVAQALARNSAVTLTMGYDTHFDVFDVGGALEKLPGLREATPDQMRRAE